MGKRYYCEYCCRAFQDNLIARKKHLKSLSHIRKRDEWYRNFKDKKTILSENLIKKPCHKFLSSGTCPFGDHCKYRHMQEKELLQLKSEVENSTKPTELPPADEIVRKWFASRKSIPKGSEMVENSKVEDSVLPETLKVYEPLPPSLLPPPSGGWIYSCDDLAEWG